MNNKPIYTSNSLNPIPSQVRNPNKILKTKLN